LWGKQFSSTNPTVINGLAVDAGGNTVVALRFYGTLDVDPGPGVVNFTNSLNGIAIVKLNPSGSLVWAKQLVQTISENEVYSVATDANGNIYITGLLNGTTDFDPSAATANVNGPANYFAKYNSSGQYQWVKVLSASSANVADIETDLNGNILITGRFYQATDFDPGAGTHTLTPNGNINAYFAKYDNSGNFIWAKQLRTSVTSTGIYQPTLKVDNQNNIILTGIFEAGNVDLDPGANTSYTTHAGGVDIYLAKYDNAGNYSWGKSVGSNNHEQNPTVSVDVNNEVFLAFNSGQTNFDADDGPGVFVLTNNGSNDIFSIKYAEDGAFVTGMNIGSPYDDIPLTSCAKGNKLFIGGYKYYNLNLDFDPGPGVTSHTFYPAEYHGIFAQYTIAGNAEITADPSNITVCEGQESSFQVSATGSSLSYKWQVDDGNGWREITDNETYQGANSNKLIIAATPHSLNSYQYRCLVTPQGGSPLTSEAAILTVNSLPKVSSQPTEAIICLGQNATFSIAATGTEVTYQWQVNIGDGWDNLVNEGPYSGVHTNTLLITNPGASLTNGQYRCLVSGACTPPDASNAVALVINASPSISSQTGNVTTCDGGNATFSVTAIGAGATYQWQISNGKGGFTDLSNNSTYSGVTSKELAISGVTTSMSGTEYRCIVTGNCAPPANSTPVTLTVRALPSATVQAANSAICAGTSTAINFSGTPGARISYKINEGNPQTIDLNEEGTASVNTGNLSSKTVYNLLSAQYTDGTSCLQNISSQVQVTVKSLPTVTINGSTTLCSGNGTTIQFLGTPNTTVGYTVNGSASSIEIGNSGSASLATGELTATTEYVLTNIAYTEAPGCTQTASGTAQVVINPIPDVDETSNIVACNNESISTISFSGNVVGTQFSWTNNNTNIGLAAAGTGNITSFKATNVTNEPITATITVTPKYTNNGVTCTGTPKTFTITVNPTPSLTQPQNQTVCNGSSNPLTSLAGVATSYSWINDETSIGLASSGTGDIPLFVATNPGNTTIVAHITVTPYYDNGGKICSGAPKTYTITVYPTATVTSILDKVHCNKENAAAISFTSPVAGTSFTWKSTHDIGFGTSGNSNIGAYKATNNTSSTIIATVTVTPSANGCAGTPFSFTITVYPTPNVNAVTNRVHCNKENGSAISFSGSVANTHFVWNSSTDVGFGTEGSGDISQYIAINNGTTPLISTITVTPSANGYTGTPIEFTITVHPTATVNTVANRIHCNKENSSAINFSSSVDGASYSWTSTADVGFGTEGSGNIGSYQAKNNTSVPVTATITVTPSANGCTGTAFEFTITVNPTPTVNTVTNQVYCNTERGSAISFSGPVSGSNYHWTSSSNVGFGLSGDGNILGFTASNTTNSPVVSTITVTPSANGCTGTAFEFTITVNPTPTVNTVADRIHCNSENANGINFTGPVPGTTFKWVSSSDIGFGTSGVGNISPYAALNNSNAPITATITVTPYANNCTGTPRTFSITVNPTPTVRASISSQTVCSGNPITGISFTGDVEGTVYHWTRNNNTVTGIANSGQGNISGVMSHTSTSAQTVTFTITPEANGCFGTPISVTVIVNPLTYISAQPLAATQFALENTSFSITATGTAPVTYKWQINDGSGWSDVVANGVYSGENTAVLSLTGVVFAMNNYEYRCIVSGGCSSVTSNAAKLTVTKRPTTLTYSGDASEQYSDVTDVKAVLIDQRTNTPVVGKTIVFTLGSQSASTQTVASGLAATTITIVQDPSTSYNVISNFGGDDTYALSSDSDPFDVIQENARIDYTGIEFIATPCATCLSATVLLKATVQDISVPTSPADPLYDANSGDIRNAWVKFVNRDNGTDISSWIPVTTLISNGDMRTGTVDFSYPVTLGSTEDAKQITVGMIVNNGYYIRNDASDNTVITVYKPQGESITGGGFVRPTKSDGVYASDLTKRMNFGLNVKYTKNGAQPKGNVNIVFRRTVGTELRTYQIKSNSIASVGVGGTNAIRRGQFVSRSTLTDITNPLSPVSLGGNLNLTITMTDQGEPGDKDSIGVTLYGSNGSLWYSSNWIVSKTNELNVLSGNVVINSASFGSVSQISTFKASSNTEESTDTQPLSIKVLNNPSSYNFRVIATGKKDQTILLSVVDMFGKQIYAVKTTNGKSVEFGSSFAGGTYVLMAIQGQNKATTKLIKQ
jgi:hypothetical protein